MMARARQWSLVASLVINVIAAATNLYAVGRALWQHRIVDAQVSGALVALFGVVVWLQIAFERRVQLKIATAEAYLDERKADTRLKQLLVEKVGASGGTLEYDGERVRAH